MGKITDFHCGYDNSAGLTKEIAMGTDLTFPMAYEKAESMAILSKGLKEKDAADFCQLPFCHTVEGEAMGGLVNLGDENNGPRAKEYLCTTAEEVLELPNIDFSKGRIAEVLKACRLLREQGENVVLYISGPFTILNVLMEPRYVFKTFKKKPEMMQRIFDKLQRQILLFIEEAQKSGVNMISYGDSSGSLNILGPKFSEDVVKMFTYPLLKKIEKNLSSETLVLLCPKTTYGLLGMEKAQLKDVDLGSPMKYGEGCLKAVGRVKFVGEMCINNKKFVLKNGIIKTVNLL